MSARSRRRSLRIQAESTYGTDPTSGDSGASLVLVPAEGLGPPEDGIQVNPTAWFTGRNTPTAAELGVDGASLKFQSPVPGLATAAGDGGSPPANDWLSILLEAAFGAATDLAGEGVGSGSAAGTLVTDASPAWGIQDLIPVYESGANGNRTQWRRSASAGTPYTVAPEWTTTPSTAAIGYGYERYVPNDAGGASLAAYVDLDGTPYVLAGGRPVALSIKGEAGKRILADWQLRFDSKTQVSRASAPVISGYSGPATVMGTKSEFFWGTTAYLMKSFTVDFGIAAQDAPSCYGANGRADIEVVRTEPVVTLELPWVVGWETAFRAGTVAPLLLQLGGGTLSGGVLNSLCFYAGAAQVEAAPSHQDDNGVSRWQVRLKVIDGGIFTGSTATRFWQLARA